MRVDFVSLFPEMLAGLLGHSILGRAAATGRVAFRTANPRDYAYDRHQKVDDTPFGGEPGMLLRAEPVALALESLQPVQGAAVVMTDPAGIPFTQASAQALSELSQVVFLCGHYEGIDHRVKTQLCTHAFSIGDYVLTNGEMPALVMADAIVRLLPGVLGNAASLEADSHSRGLLSAPNFTRPEVWRGEAVPAVLRSGDHRAIAKWRREQALRLTRETRPDLLARARLEKGDLDVLIS
ncbi:MAG: tRNA (guanosine(37)-N1)-methyltransferase TrmD [Fimbriimonas sp.]